MDVHVLSSLLFAKTEISVEHSTMRVNNFFIIFHLVIHLPVLLTPGGSLYTTVTTEEKIYGFSFQELLLVWHPPKGGKYKDILFN